MTCLLSYLTEYSPLIFLQVCFPRRISQDPKGFFPLSCASSCHKTNFQKIHALLFRTFVRGRPCGNYWGEKAAASLHYSLSLRRVFMRGRVGVTTHHASAATFFFRKKVCGKWWGYAFFVGRGEWAETINNSRGFFGGGRIIIKTVSRFPFPSLVLCVGGFDFD